MRRRLCISRLPPCQLSLCRRRSSPRAQVWGEDVVLQSERLRSKVAARALNYVAAYYISRAELFMLAQRFPKASHLIRRFAIRLAFGRQLVALARIAQDQQHNSTLKRIHVTNEFLSTIAGAMEVQQHGANAASAFEPVPQGGDAGSNADGGRLEGYKADMGVQFEILGNKLNELRDELRAEQAAMAVKLSDALKEALTQLRADMGLPSSVPATNAPEQATRADMNGKDGEQRTPILGGLLFA